MNIVYALNTHKSFQKFGVLPEVSQLKDCGLLKAFPLNSDRQSVYSTVLNGCCYLIHRRFRGLLGSRKDEVY